MSELYRKSGVDISKGDAFITGIKKILSRYPVNSDRLFSGVGGFASLYQVGDRYLAAGSDGVGTKIKLAEALDDFSTIGIDLVAMCLNDIACTGAKPLFFMDYLACEKLNEKRDLQIIEGIAKACFETKALLIGGETAEMPGVYPPGGVDLAGFAVGEVALDQVITGEKINEGDSVVAVASTGLHSNGFSLFRHLFKEADDNWMRLALTPTRLYGPMVERLIEKFPIHGLAHITGGGLSNLTRILPPGRDLTFSLDNPLSPLEASPLYEEVIRRAKDNWEELYQVFNMGMGFIVITPTPDKVIELVQKDFSFTSQKVGEMRKDKSHKIKIFNSNQWMDFS